MEDIDDDLATKCTDLKTYISNLESGFNKQLQDLSQTLEKNEEKYQRDFKLTQEKLAAINEKVIETRQIIGGTSSNTSKENNLFVWYVNFVLIISDGQGCEWQSSSWEG